LKLWRLNDLTETIRTRVLPTSRMIRSDYSSVVARDKRPALLITVKYMLCTADYKYLMGVKLI